MVIQNTKNSLLSSIECDIAKVLIEETTAQKISEEDCEKVAKEILKLLPENISLTELEKILPKLKEVYPDLAKISIKYLDSIEKKISEEKIVNIRQKINQILYGTKIS